MKNIPQTWWTMAAAALLLAAALPVVASWYRTAGQNLCAMDGTRIDARLRVAMTDLANRHYEFCSLACGEHWLRASGQQPVEILVTDETTGAMLDAREAVFVQSQVIAHAPSRDRRHVFRHAAEAESHAAVFHGRILKGDDLPFATPSSFKPGMNKRD